MKNTENLLYYISGYIDGDGCFYLGKFNKKSITVYEYSLQVVSVKELVLQEFKKEFGGCVRIKPYKERHRDAFCWTIKGPDAVNLAKSIQNILIEKRIECSLFIDFTKIIERNKFKVVENSVIDRRNKIIEQIRKEKHMNNKISREDIEKLKDQANTITPTDLDYPYLAGLMDSEGCFRIKKWKPKNRPNDVYSISIEIGNTKLPIMPWLIKRFGGSIIFIEGKGKKRSSATWTLSAAALFKILPKIRPFLRSKQIVCDKLIEFQETILSNGGDRHSALFKAMFEKRREIRERIISEVHEFNRTGSH